MKSLLGKIIFSILGSFIINNALAQKEVEIARQVVPAEYGYKVNIGEAVPDFSMTLLNGKNVSSKDWKGKIVMLQFTASWCGVCRKEMPSVEKEIWLKNKHHPDFLLYAVDRDEPEETVKKFKKEMPVTYPFAMDPNANIFGLFADKKAGVTRNVIIDRQGKIVFLTRLYKEEEFREMVKVITRLLGEK